MDGNKFTLVIYLIIATFLKRSECIRNLQLEEPHFVKETEHPNIDENSEIDRNPFLPDRVSKPTLPTVVANCKCGEHDFSGATIKDMECGERPKMPSSSKSALHNKLVINGTFTDKSQFPWVVALVSRLANGTAIHFCGGTLISSKLVLTATHCFTRKSILRTEVWLNERNLLLSTHMDYPTLKIKAQRLIVHPNYNPIMNYNDIVLVELSEPVNVLESHLRPICLPNSESYDTNEYAFTAGWGQTSYKGPKSDRLRHVCLPLLSHEDCTTKTADYYKERVTTWMICGGDLKNGGRDSCPGDSGGPLFVESGSRYFLVGIVSWGEQCGLPNRPGVYTRVSKYLPWIHKEAGKIEDNTMCG